MVYWGTSALTTTYGSATQLTAQVPATDIATGGTTAAITVQTPSPGGGTSNSFQFEVNSASGSTTGPTFTSTTATVTAGSPASYPVTLPSTVESASVTCLNLPTGATCSYSATTNTLTQIVTNHPPVVSNLSYTRVTGQDTLSIPISDLINAASDVDGDRMKTWQEYVAGTDPTNWQSVFKAMIEPVGGSGVSVFFQSRRASGTNYSGRSRFYDIETATDLLSGVWLPVANETNLPGTDAIVSYTNGVIGPQGFYRLRTKLR